MKALLVLIITYLLEFYSKLRNLIIVCNFIRCTYHNLTQCSPKNYTTETSHHLLLLQVNAAGQRELKLILNIFFIHSFSPYKVLIILNNAMIVWIFAQWYILFQSHFLLVLMQNNKLKSWAPGLPDEPPRKSKKQSIA